MEQVLSSPPVDGITRVRYGDTADLLLASSWDCVRRMLLLSLSLHSPDLAAWW